MMNYAIEDIYREVVESYPDDFRSHLQLGFFLWEIRRHNDARKVLSTALDMVYVALKKTNHRVDTISLDYIATDIKDSLITSISFRKQIRREIMNYQTDVMMKLLSRRIHFIEPSSTKLLDVGCGIGLRTLKLAESVNIPRANIVGLDVLDNEITSASRFFTVHKMDFEFEDVPLPNNSINVIVCNQVLEDMKNVTWILSEMHRVLSIGGYILIGVPNLAALHNRLLLLLGKQPTCINIFSDHTRGYTFPSLCSLLTHGGGLEVVDYAGNGMYPLPLSISSHLSILHPKLSVQLFILLRKTAINTEPIWEIPPFCRRLQGR